MHQKVMKHISHLVGTLINKIVVFLDFENPQVFEENLLHPEKVTVWFKVLIESHFYENDDGTTVTVNTESYGHMIIDLFCLLLKNATWFQQDSATCHTTTANMALLQDTFPGRVISRHVI